MGMVFCPVLTHPSMSLQNHPDLIPPSSVLPTYPIFSWNPGAFPWGDPSILSDHPEHCWLTNSPLPAPPCSLVFQHLGKCLLSHLIHRIHYLCPSFQLPSSAFPSPSQISAQDIAVLGGELRVQQRWLWAVAVGIPPSNTMIPLQLLIS